MHRNRSRLRYWQSKCRYNIQPPRPQKATGTGHATSADSAGPVRMLQAGTLDDPNAVTPTVAIYVKDALSWDRIDSGVTKFEHLPPAPPRV